MEEANCIKKQLERSRACLRLNMLSGFKEDPVVDILNIPEIKSPFPGSNGDYWVKAKSEKGVRSCIYSLNTFGLFRPHKHSVFHETITILTKGASVEWVTDEGIFFHEHPDSFEAPKGVRHSMVNLSAFPVEFRVDWVEK